MPGIVTDRFCDPCKRNRRTAMILKALPEEGERGWGALSQWEKDFLPSVREQWAARGTLSPTQHEKLEQIWRKV